MTCITTTAGGGILDSILMRARLHNRIYGTPQCEANSECYDPFTTGHWHFFAASISGVDLR
jgi:hypothetical protein